MGCQDKDWLMQTVLTLLWGQNCHQQPHDNHGLIILRPNSFPTVLFLHQNHNQCEAASVPKSSLREHNVDNESLVWFESSAFVACVPTKMIILSMWSPLVRAGTGSTVKFANTTSVCILMITPGSV